jgi:heptaprenyl diphosphate synthase
MLGNYSWRLGSPRHPLFLLYLPWLAIFGLLAGFFIGVAGNALLYKIKPINALLVKENKSWMTHT